MKGRYCKRPFFMPKPYKIPESVLVVVFTDALDVLLIRRTDGDDLGAEYWQSVTGSKDRHDEDLMDTAVREVWEETGIDCSAGATQATVLRDWKLVNVYGIYPQWLHRYPPGITHNTEHLFGLRVAAGSQIRMNPREHTAYQWLPYREAADRCFSPSNAEAILQLPRMSAEMAIQGAGAA
jgi:dATP pyrophosphohydrolase